MNNPYHKPWSRYSPVDNLTASQYELDQQYHNKHLTFSNSIDSNATPADLNHTGTAHPLQPEQARMKSSLGYQGFVRWWLPEIVSSLFSVASLTALIVVLRVYNGRGLDDLRLPSWLTLNGLVAVIATLNRIALVAPVEAAMSQEVWLWFSSAKQKSRARSRLEDLEISDRASRGAWGSFIFLTRGGGGRWLSYIGAIIIIVSLAFGAFTQQLIGIVTLPVSESGPEELIPGNIPHAESFMNSTGDAAEDGLSTLLSIKAAVYNGMLEGNLAPLPASCPTGNCTFPVTPTVAVCGECKDVSYSTSCNSTDCQYTLSTGTVMNLTNWFSGEGTYGLGFQVVPRNNGSLQVRRVNIATFDVFGAPYGSFTSSWPNSSTTSSTCSLWMCVNALSVSVKNNQQQQAVTSTFSKTALPISMDDFGGDESVNFADLPAEMNPRPGASYTVGWFAEIALSSFLEPLVTGNVTLNLESQIPSSDTIEAIWNGTVNGLDGWVKNLALSMTNAVRATTPATAPRYNGTAYQSGIQIRWEWLALPVAMVVLSLFVLVTVMIETSRARVRAWKGSPLAYLMSDVDQSIKDDVGSVDVDSFKGLERAVGRRRVVLDSQARTGRLIFREVR